MKMTQPMVRELFRYDKDKDFIFDVMALMRKLGKEKTGDERNLILGSANIMERLLRRVLDLEEEKAAKERD